MEALERRGKLIAVAAIFYIVFWSNCKGVVAKNHSMSYVCPPQFIRLGHSCYFFSEDKATWHSALFFCKDRDSNLSVPARWEDRNLRNYLNKQQIDKASRWIGGIYDMASQAWKWGGELRSMHYQSFSKMKKLTASQLQFQCIAMMPELLYRWAPKSCFEPRQFICQTKIKKVHKSKLKELQKRYQRMGKINEITAPSVSREVNDNRINEVTINPVLNPKSYDLRPSPLRRGPKKNPNRNKTHGPRQNELRKRSRPHAERRLKRPFPGYQWNRLKPQESYQHNVEVLLSGRTGLSEKRVKYHLSRLQRLRDRQLHRLQNDDWLDNTPAIVHTHARTYTINNNISALHPKTIVEEFEMLAPPPVVMPRPTRGICGTISIYHRSVVEGGMASGQFTRDRAVDPWSWNASSDFTNDAMTEDIPETGAVFTFGKSHFADNEPSHFFIKNDPIVAISCGDEHSAVICQNGRVFVFGANSWGQLGLGHKDEVTRPSCVKFLKPHRAIFVACGRAHTVFVTDTNAIYSVGCNDQGQLGSGDLEQHSVPQYVELQVSVRHVSAGCDHTALLTEDGRVFVCGSNAEGQLGLGEDTRSALAFTELKFMESIAFVECGYYHTVFITVKGAVFVTGDNENQKLGIPNTLGILYVPQVLPLDVQIKSACCGANHTFLLSMDESKILAFGSNEKGQLGMPKDVVNVTEPTEINMEKMFDGYQLKLVACGAMHTAFVTDNGLLYTCGEARHNKLCLEDTDDNTNSNELPNQYSPQRVTSMNGFVVDNVSCGGCHTLLTATKGSNADFTNNDFSIISEENRPVSLTELPPLQKVPAINKIEDTADFANSNIDRKSADLVNGNINDESRSIDSLEANVSGSHIVDINDLETDNKSLQDLANLNAEDHNPEMEFKKDIDNIMESLETETNKAKDKIDNTVQNVTETIHTQAEVIEDIIKKTVANSPSPHHDEKKVLEIPNKVADIANSPPPKTPIIQDLLDIPDITHMSPNLSKHSDDGQKSETGQSENETIPCGSDKSSPQAKTKTQAVMPIVRSEDHIDGQEDGDVVVSKIEKGRFARMFQSIRDKEHSCMGKGKVIEEKIVENVHKGLEDAEETVHKVEERVETEIRNQTNSRTCTIL